MFHLAAYSESLGSVTNTDVDAAADDVLGQRNSHLILTEPYDIIAHYGAGSTLTRARFGNAALQQVGIPHLFPLGRSDTVPARPEVADRRMLPISLPTDEEITIEATTDAVGPIVTNFVLWMKPQSHTYNLPMGEDRLQVRATVVIAAGTATEWTALATPTFERDLLNGTYAVVGAVVIAANAIAFRLRFPDSRDVQGKQLRPGGLVMNTVGLMPWEPQFGGLGEWGRFHTFTLPQIQVLDDTAGGTYEVRLDLVRIGTGRDLVWNQ